MGYDKTMLFNKYVNKHKNEQYKSIRIYNKFICLINNIINICHYYTTIYHDYFIYKIFFNQIFVSKSNVIINFKCNKKLTIIHILMNIICINIRIFLYNIVLICAYIFLKCGCQNKQCCYNMINIIYYGGYIHKKLPTKIFNNDTLIGKYSVYKHSTLYHNLIKLKFEKQQKIEKEHVFLKKKYNQYYNHILQQKNTYKKHNKKKTHVNNFGDNKIYNSVDLISYDLSDEESKELRRIEEKLEFLLLLMKHLTTLISQQENNINLVNNNINTVLINTENIKKNLLN